jgi:hypothetical protein
MESTYLAPILPPIAESLSELDPKGFWTVDRGPDATRAYLRRGGNAPLSILIRGLPHNRLVASAFWGWDGACAVRPQDFDRTLLNPEANLAALRPARHLASEIRRRIVERMEELEPVVRKGLDARQDAERRKATMAGLFTEAWPGISPWPSFKDPHFSGNDPSSDFSTRWTGAVSYGGHVKLTIDTDREELVRELLAVLARRTR